MDDITKHPITASKWRPCICQLCFTVKMILTVHMGPVFNKESVMQMHLTPTGLKKWKQQIMDQWVKNHFGLYLFIYLMVLMDKDSSLSTAGWWDGARERELWLLCQVLIEFSLSVDRCPSTICCHWVSDNGFKMTSWIFFLRGWSQSPNNPEMHYEWFFEKLLIGNYIGKYWVSYSINKGRFRSYILVWNDEVWWIYILTWAVFEYICRG